MDDTWFYELEGTRRGPHTLAEMKQLVASGVIRRQTAVWAPGGAADAPAARAEEFLALLNPPARGNDASLAYLLPVGRSGWAIAAGYVGLLSFLPVVSFAGMVVSLIAARQLKRHPEKRGWGRVITGIVISVPMSVFYTWLFLRH